MPANVDLSTFGRDRFDRGASAFKEALWVITSQVVFRLCPVPLSPFKRGLLRMFGAQVGADVVIKPDVRITFPWRLTIGNNVWLGEGSWLLNLAPIEIQDSVCISQRALLSTGSHDYKSASFDLIAKPIIVEKGSWICSGAWVGPGVRVGSHAVLTANSVASHDLEPYGIYRGNPCQLVRRRSIAEGTVG